MSLVQPNHYTRGRVQRVSLRIESDQTFPHLMMCWIMRPNPLIRSSGYLGPFGHHL